MVREQSVMATQIRLISTSLSVLLALICMAAALQPSPDLQNTVYEDSMNRTLLDENCTGAVNDLHKCTGSSTGYPTEQSRKELTGTLYRFSASQIAAISEEDRQGAVEKKFENLSRFEAAEIAGTSEHDRKETKVTPELEDLYSFSTLHDELPNEGHRKEPTEKFEDLHRYEASQMADSGEHNPKESREKFEKLWRYSSPPIAVTSKQNPKEWRKMLEDLHALENSRTAREHSSEHDRQRRGFKLERLD